MPPRGRGGAGDSLQSLQQLTCLLIDGSSDLNQVLPALGGLSRLQQCSVIVYGDTSEARPLAEPGPPLASSLPSGAWLRSLRWLQCSFPTLVNSVEQLAAAQQLEYLSIAGVPTAGSADLDLAAHSAFWDWAARHPPLRRLGLELVEPQASPVPSDFLNEVLILWQRRPALLVILTANEGQRNERPPFAEAASADGS